MNDSSPRHGDYGHNCWEGCAAVRPGHSFSVDSRCECGVAMSFLIRAGAEVAARAADLLRESILNLDGDLSHYMARLNLALVRYSAGKHQEGDVALLLGGIEPGDD